MMEHLLLKKKTSISEREPRKGTETITFFKGYANASPYFRTWTPKGDGNETVRCTNSSSVWRFQNVNPERGRKLRFHGSYKGNLFRINFRTWTPKGDGNWIAYLSFPLYPCRISEREPRKGTETIPVYGIIVLPRRISEREPRKGTETGYNFFLPPISQAISEREPRKGTETSTSCAHASISTPYFRTWTPKGDGNHLAWFSEWWCPWCISEREPRKGTETLIVGYWTSKNNRISEREPRKGTET